MRTQSMLLMAAILFTTSAGTATAAQSSAGEASEPSRIAVGTNGFWRPGLLLQAWFQNSNDIDSRFRVRRAEISAKGEIVPGLVSYGVMFDPAKVREPQAGQVASPVSVFQDFYVTVMGKYVDVSAGQVKIPVSWEGFNSSSKLLFPERALVSNQFGDKRDIGLRFSKAFPFFGYTAGVFNGTGPNTFDTNEEKDVTLRLEGYPVPGLLVAGVVYATIGGRNTNAKDRYEGDVRYQRGPLLLQAEYIRGHDIDASAKATDSHGFYVAAAWTFMGLLQPAVRVGYLDPDVDADVDPVATSGKDEVWHVDAGLNYLLRANQAKLQLSLSRFEYDTRSAVNEVILAGQVSF